MANFKYKAINQEGKYITGKISAENPSELMSLLKSSSLELVSYREEKNRALNFLGGLKSGELVTIFIHLEQLDKAGVSIIDSIHDLKETTDSIKLKNLMQEIYESIKNGNLFSESLAKRPDIFKPTYIGLIAMGEKTGNLSASFANIVDDIKWNIEIRRKTRKAIVGPLFGVILMFLVLGVMTAVVVPKVTGFLSAQSIDLPFLTVALINFSNFIQEYWLTLISTPLIIWLTIKILERFPTIHVKIDYIKLKTPIFGAIITKIESAKFCQFFSMTFKSGLGVLECLDASSIALKNRAIRSGISYVRQQVSDGQSLSGSISATKFFPNLVVRMFKVGEESGNMESALKNIKYFYDKEINDSIERLVGLIQPTITVVMGGMIAWIAVAVFGPIYSTFSNLQ
ncbi:MAG: type II secretion system F family protein [Alphaproteobacteria bacterium]|nr:type II secretion system F family protein [Alphaproteobacteria bacterium]